MIHHHRSLVIDASAQAVWQVIGRFMHIDEFAPLIKTVEALTEGEDRVGSKRRCHFVDGGALVEEVTEWEVNRRYRVRLSETEPMPLKEAYAELRLTPHTAKAGQGTGRGTGRGTGQTLVTWSMEYRIKYGVFGWLLGQTMMKIMMGKVLDGNLKGLEDKVRSNRAA